MKITEFQRKTYEKTINHIFSFVPDEGGITGEDVLTIIKHCVVTIPDNELDALFDINAEKIHGIKRSKMFDRDKKEYAVGMSLLNIIMGAAEEGKKDEQE